MKQEFLMLADGAEATNGKVYILGGGADRHYVQRGWTSPIQLRADIALGILVNWGETNNQHSMSVRILDEDENEVLAISANFEAGRPPGAKPGQDLRSLMAIRGPFPVPKLGAYKLVLQLADKAQEPPFRFWVDEVGQLG